MTETKESNVVSINPPPPKERRLKYRDAEIVIKYDPATGGYNYSFSIPMALRLTGSAATLRRAENDAKRRIDKTLEA